MHTAKKFYSTVFDWRFNRTTSSDGRQLSPDEIAMFELPDKSCPGGGITRVSEADWASSHGKGGVVLYLYVDDIRNWEEVTMPCPALPESLLYRQGYWGVLHLLTAFARTDNHRCWGQENGRYPA